MLDFAIDQSLCTRCGLCTKDCPTRIIEKNDDGFPFISPDNEENCLECQHCLAICPTAALSILGRNPGDSLSLQGDVYPSPSQMETLIRGRRSMRHYRKENVDHALMDEILAAVANCPTGVNMRKLSFTLIDDMEAMERLRQDTMRDITHHAATNGLPDRFAYFQRYLDAWVKHGADGVYRGAPHILIVSSPMETACYHEDVSLALAYFELLAQCHGIGTTWCGLFKMVLEMLPQYKERLELPETDWYYPMLFGMPDHKYARTVQRDDAARIKRIRY